MYIKVTNYLEEKYGNSVSTKVKMEDELRKAFVGTKVSELEKHLKEFIESQIDSKLLSRPKNKIPNNFTIAPLNFRWHIDLIDMKNYVVDNNSYAWILTCIDSFSRFAYVVALKTKEAEEVNEGMKTIFKMSKDIPKIIYSDQGPEFLNKYLGATEKRLRIKHMYTKPYTPQSNGMV